MHKKKQSKSSNSTKHRHKFKMEEVGVHYPTQTAKWNLKLIVLDASLIMQAT
jgi:hypothetical protein